MSIPCNEFVETVTEYLEGVLGPDAVADIDAHLEECPPCAGVLDQFRTIIRQVGRLRDVDVAAIDPEVRAALIEAFAQRHGSVH